MKANKNRSRQLNTWHYGLLIILCFILFMINGSTQTMKPIYIRSTNNIYDTSSLLKVYTGNVFGLGLENSYPFVRLHLRDKNVVDGPAVQIETNIHLNNSYPSFGSLEFFTLKESGYYGIYQSSNPFMNLLNHFQDPIEIGKTIFGLSDSNKPGISMDTTGTFTFSYRPAGRQTEFTEPLRINSNGIEVTNLLETHSFQMRTNAGSGKVLVSDALGNGIWITPPNTGYWEISHLGTLYSNPTTLNVAIGTEDAPQGYKLAVNGKIICEELRCKLFTDWPDTVFSKDYPLPSLKFVEQFTNTNKHLPGTPSAKEVKENGVNLGEMNALLLKKVEELTRYMIALQKEVDELKGKMNKN